MIEQGNILEIAKMMQDENQIKTDMADAYGAFVDVFQKRYVNKVERTIEKYRKNLIENPTKEIALLRALQPFAEPEAQLNIEKSIDSMITVNTLRKMQSEMQPPSYETILKTATTQDSSIHDDGIYDYDSHCINMKAQTRQPLLSNSSNNNILFMLMMMGLFRQ